MRPRSAVARGGSLAAHGKEDTAKTVFEQMSPWYPEV